METRSALQMIVDEAQQGDIVFPTHSAIALRVQQALDDPACTTEALGKLIGAEPLLSARVMGVANSIAYNPGGRPVSDLKSAIARIGFAALRALAAAIVVRQMQGSPQTAKLRALASGLWEHTAHVASLARLLARRVTRQNPDAAFFAGIVHEVGSFYLISRTAHYPDLLAGELDAWHADGETRVGRAVMQALEIPSHIVEAVDTLWSGYLAMPPTSLGDTLLLADEIAPIESPIGALAGMSRQGMNVELEMLVGPETLSEILAESADEVASLIHTLND